MVEIDVLQEQKQVLAMDAHLAMVFMLGIKKEMLEIYLMKITVNWIVLKIRLLDVHEVTEYLNVINKK